MFSSSVVGLYSISDRVPDKLQTRVRGFAEWSRTYAGRDGAEPDVRPLYGALCVITVCHRAALLESAITTRDDYRLTIRWVFAQFSTGLCNPSIRAPCRKVMRRADLDIFLPPRKYSSLVDTCHSAGKDRKFIRRFSLLSRPGEKNRKLSCHEFDPRRQLSSLKRRHGYGQNINCGTWKHIRCPLKSNMMDCASQWKVKIIPGTIWNVQEKSHKPT